MSIIPLKKEIVRIKEVNPCTPMPPKDHRKKNQAEMKNANPAVAKPIKDNNRRGNTDALTILWKVSRTVLRSE